MCLGELREWCPDKFIKMKNRLFHVKISVKFVSKEKLWLSKMNEPTERIRVRIGVLVARYECTEFEQYG